MRFCNNTISAAPIGRPYERAGAAQDDHQQHFGRADHVDVIRADEAVEIDVEAAREPGECRRHHEGNKLVAPYIVPQHQHPGFALADAAQDVAKGRSDDADQHHRADNKKEQDEIVERRVVGHRPREAQVRSWDLGKPVIAAGERTPAEGDPPYNLRQRQGDHQEIAASGAQRQQAEHNARRARPSLSRREGRATRSSPAFNASRPVV